MSRVVLLGIPWDLAGQLTEVLRDEAHVITPEIGPESEVAFISGDDPEFTGQLGVLRGQYPHLPVIVVTRLPDTARWLDALDAGANDYCGAPFEHVQIRWIMDSACPPAVLRAA